jgi:hypothetical protein
VTEAQPYSVLFETAFVHLEQIEPTRRSTRVIDDRAEHRSPRLVHPSSAPKLSSRQINLDRHLTTGSRLFEEDYFLKTPLTSRGEHFLDIL